VQPRHASEVARAGYRYAARFGLFFMNERGTTMGREAVVQSTDRVTDDGGTDSTRTNGTDVTVDPGGGGLVTAQHFADAGDDSLPLPGDFVALDESAGKGAEKTSGYVDPVTPKKAAPGGKRIYSRTAPHVVAAELHLHPDGTATLEIFTGKPLTLRTSGPIIIDSPDVRLGGPDGGRRIACLGDFVAVSAPRLLCSAPGSPAVAENPLANTPNGYSAAGQIISACAASTAK
jgi:hypothetical protein